MNSAHLLPSPVLCLITNLQLAGGERQMLKIVEAALDGGVNVVQLREKWATETQLLRIAYTLRKITQKRALLTINSSYAVTQKVQADGVHRPASLDKSKAFSNSNKLVGQSVHSLAEIAAYTNDNCTNYIVLGSIFQSEAHPNTKPLGLGTLKQAVLLKRNLSLIAIGGINATNASKVIKAGADGVAVVRAIINAPNPERAAHEIAKAVNI